MSSMNDTRPALRKAVPAFPGLPAASGWLVARPLVGVHTFITA